MTNKCKRCGATPARKYYLSLIHDDGLEEGCHVGDVDIHLCEECTDAVADLLMLLISNEAPAERWRWLLPHLHISSENDLCINQNSVSLGLTTHRALSVRDLERAVDVARKAGT
jgi:hypothetical protein